MQPDRSGESWRDAADTAAKHRRRSLRLNGYTRERAIVPPQARIGRPSHAAGGVGRCFEALPASFVVRFQFVAQGREIARAAAVERQPRERA